MQQAFSRGWSVTKNVVEYFGGHLLKNRLKTRIFRIIFWVGSRLKNVSSEN